MRKTLVLFSLLASLAMAGAASAADEAPVLTNAKVVEMTRFLEDNPLDEDAPFMRAALLTWEDKSRDTEDVVCEQVLGPILDDSDKYASELMAQFIFGSAAYQLENPADKGKLEPAQLAGMKSMLKAYRAFLAKEPKARFARLEELSRAEEDGSLAQVLEPFVAACKPADK